MTTLRTMWTTSITGLPLSVVHLPPGTYAGIPGGKSDSEQIEFYDTRFNHTLFGQFISRYYVDTFMAPGRMDRHGLALNGMEQNWTISASEVCRIKRWLREP